MRNRSIRSSILLNSIIIILVPLALFGYLTLEYFISVYEDEVVRRNHIITMNLAERFALMQEEPVHITDFVIENCIDRVSDGDEEVNTVLADLIASYPYVLNIEILGDQANVLASGMKRNDIGISRSGEFFYEKLSGQKEGYYWSTPYMSTAIGDLTYVMVRKTKTDHYILIYSSLQSLSESSTAYAGQFGENVHVAILDQLGRYISHEEIDKVNFRMIDDNIDTIRRVAGGEMSHETVDIEDIAYVINATLMPIPEWYVVVYQPLDSVFGFMHTLQTIFMAMVLVSVIITSIHTLRFSGQINEFMVKMKDAMDNAIINGYQLEVKDFRYKDLNEVNARFISMMDEVRSRDEQLYRHAYYDQLTGIANRLAMSDYISRHIESSKDIAIDLALINIDEFRIINDIYGHDVGDELLVYVSDLLIKEGKKADCKVYYMGGNEFGMVVPNPAEKPSVGHILESIRSALLQGVYISSRFLRISMTIGIARYPEHTKDGKQLYQYADIALIEAKDNNRGGIGVFDKSMHKRIENRSKLDRMIREGLENNRFELFYQPQISLITGSIVGFEGLIRLRKSNGDLVPPKDFIPIAESTGLIIELGEWIIHQAISDLKKLNTSYERNYKMGINISTIQMRSPNFAENFLDIVKESGVDLSLLELEITESVFIGDESTAFESVNNLSNAGICFSLDDFGTGYSSLSYLTSMPFKYLKVDRMFIADIERVRAKKKMLKSIVDMGHRLDLTIVAEGVETEEQWRVCSDYGVDVVQGYYFSRPIPYDELTAFIEKNETNVRY